MSGDTGAKGDTGSKGDTGAKGANGTSGPAGPRGAQGPRGRARGKNAAVTCKVAGTKRDPHVACTVKYEGGSAQDRVVRLVRQGHTVAAGRGAHLEAASRLPIGAYTLVVGAGKSVDRLAVTVG